MTTTAMEHPEDGANPALPLVVLTINSADSQRYLVSDNQLLSNMYGHAPARINLSLDKNGLHHLLHPHMNESFKELPALFPHLSWSTLQEFIGTNGYIEAVRGKFTDAIVEHAKVMTPVVQEFTAAQMLAAVRVVLVSGRLECNAVLARVYGGWLPNAHIYRANGSHELPQPIEWPTNLCPACTSQLRPAGDMYVCENCGYNALAE